MLGALGLLVTNGARGMDLDVMVGAGVQLKQLYMEQKFQGVEGLDDSSGDLNATLGVLNLQSVFFVNKYYLALKYETTVKEEAYDSGIPYTGQGSGLNTGVSRSDLSLTLGAKLTNSIALFAGYMAGETELSPVAIGDCTDRNSCYNTASIMLSEGFGEYQQTYEEQGLFAGISIGRQFDKGSLGLSIAYASMDGEYKDNYRDSLGPSAFDYRGESTGLSSALSWLSPISENMAYFVDFRVQQYDMDATDYSGVTQYRNSRVSTTETLAGLSVGLQMLF